jgi:hypothetical protein
LAACWNLALANEQAQFGAKKGSVGERFLQTLACEEQAGYYRAKTYGKAKRPCSLLGIIQPKAQ